MVTWLCFIQPQRFVRDDNLDAKEYGKLSKVIRLGYVRVGEVNSLTR